MTDKHTDENPATLNSVDAKAGQRSSKFRLMLIASMILAVIAMVAIFLSGAA